MATIDFENVINSLKTGIVNLAETDLKDYVTEATQDGQAILDQMKTNLQTWTQQLADGDITPSDFTFDVASEKDSLEMAALEQAGLAEIQVDQFRDAVINLITTTITALI